MIEPDLPRPDGLIFDLDGTLVDTVDARIDGWVEVLVAAGFAVTREQVGPMIGMDGKRLARTVAEEAGGRMTDDDAETIDRDAGAAFDRRNTSPRPLPGARELLAELDERGMPWLIATSSRAEQVRRSVASLALEHEPRIVDGSRVERAKPAPDLLLLAAENLSLPPGRCWAVGDSIWDVRAARAAEMPGAGVTAGSAVGAEALREAGAALVVESLIELAEVLRAAS